MSGRTRLISDRSVGKASSSQKVARAAGIGGGRTNRGRTSWLFILVLVIVTTLGTAVVVQSRDARLFKLSLTGNTPPIPNKDHWHAAYSVYLCEKFVPAIVE